MTDAQWKPEFESRFRRCAEEMKWLYGEIYHGDLTAYDEFVGMLYQAWQDRPALLRAADREREDDPRWYTGRDLTAMQADVRAFGGSLAGVEDHLDYLSECGVGCLHLLPLLKGSGQGSLDSWAVSDFDAVQPELGTMEELASLSRACREKGILLCVDFVLNHTADDHPWALRAKAGEKEYQDRYFFYDNWELPNTYEQAMPQLFPGTAPGSFSWCQEARKAVMTTFHPNQWDLNYMNPAVFRDMTASLLRLCNRGIDVIRLDGLPYLWKALGTACFDLRQVHTLLRILRMACDTVCPGVLLAGASGLEPGRAAAYFGTVDKPECHLMENETLMAHLWNAVASRDARLLAHELGCLFSMPRHFFFLLHLRSCEEIAWRLDFGFLRNFGIQEGSHKQYLNDYLTGKWPGSPSRGEIYRPDPRLADVRLCGTAASLCGVEAARAKGDPEALRQALRLDITLHALLFTLGGVPVLFSGDEIAQENFNAYHDDPAARRDSRRLHQGPMDWKKAALRGEPASPEGQMFSALKKLAALRRAHPAFDGNADAWVVPTDNDRVLGIGRRCRGEKLIALFNFSEEAQVAWVKDLSFYTDLMTDVTIDAGAVMLPPGGFRWLLQGGEAR